MVLTNDEFKRIRDFMKTHYGIDLEGKQTLIVGRLENRLRNRGYNSYDEYIRKVEQDPKGEEAILLVNQLTTNHTFFLRESLHFTFLHDVILPDLKVTESRSHDIRIWSAAASTGEEAYTIVMVLKEFFGFEAEEWDTTLLATDISMKVLKQAQEGIYSGEHIEKLPPRWIKQHFTKISDNTYQIKEATRHEVNFRSFNLMEPFNFKKGFHVIFLRNVMIYFDDETKRQLIDKVYKALAPGGYLFIGTTETLDKTSTAFEYIQPSIYRKSKRLAR